MGDSSLSSTVSGGSVPALPLRLTVSVCCTPGVNASQPQTLLPP